MKLKAMRWMVACCFGIGATLLPFGAEPQGLIGGFLKAAGRAVGSKEVEKFGENLDAEHRRFKDNNQMYKQIEEGGSALVRRTTALACTSNFEFVVGAVRASCNRLSSQAASNDARLVEAAKVTLIQAGVASSNEFSGVSVQWCEGDFQGLGITPEENLIILNKVLKDRPVSDIALTLAHELVHIRQYRQLGSGTFKCKYSQEFVSCGACQDERHSMEREAYQFEAWAAGKIANTSSHVASSGSRVDAFVEFSARNASFVGANQAQSWASPNRVIRMESETREAARTACHLFGFDNAYDPKFLPCIDDMEIIYKEIDQNIRRDLRANALRRPRDYLEEFDSEAAASCAYVAGISKSPDELAVKTYQCKSKMTMMVDRLISVARRS